MDKIKVNKVRSVDRKLGEYQNEFEKRSGTWGSGSPVGNRANFLSRSSADSADFI